MLERHVPEAAKVFFESPDAVIYRYEKNGKPVSLAFKTRAQRPTYHYNFQDAERQAQHDQKFLENLDARNKAKAEASAERNKMHTLKVGDVLYSSWGYDQTNVDFYMVLEVRGRKVVLQEVGCKTVGEPTSWASDRVIADTENKLKEPFVKLVNGHNRVKMSSCQNARPYDGKPLHRSWYA